MPAFLWRDLLLSVEGVNPIAISCSVELQVLVHLTSTLSLSFLCVWPYLFDFRVNCVSLYFSGANVVRAHHVQASCALLRVSQIASVDLS